MEKWRGKYAVVTGASAGIGAAIVRDLAKAGVNVIALARRVEKLDALKKELEGSPGKVITRVCDVSSKQSVETTFAEIENEFGEIHVLVNNAGIARYEDEEKMKETLNCLFFSLTETSTYSTTMTTARHLKTLSKSLKLT